MSEIFNTVVLSEHLRNNFNLLYFNNSVRIVIVISRFNNSNSAEKYLQLHYKIMYLQRQI